MTLDKAIEILNDCTLGALLGISLDTKDALKLGIEALKAWKEFRGSGSLMDKMLLPSETEE